MEKIAVREAAPDDAPELARMLDAFDHSGATPEQVERRMIACREVLTTFLAELAGQPVGFACLRLIPHIQGDAPYAELTDIYVDPSARRRGVAGALIAHIESVAIGAGADELVIITGFDNETARRAYHASGYADWALAMRKELRTE